MSLPRVSQRPRLARQLAQLIERIAGIAIPEHQYDGMLQKAQTLVPASESLASYLKRIAADDAMLQRFVEGMCTHETRFFRHADQFAELERVWVPARLSDFNRRKVRAWSVACSSGEEPFSLAMFLADHFPKLAGWSVEVLGTDFSTQVLERAGRATWPLARHGEISLERLDRYMLRGHGKQIGLMRASADLRALVRFQQLNLKQPPYAVGHDFDLIFLRNVLIYFSTETRREVVRSVLASMAPGGLLVTGPSEGVSHLQQERLLFVSPHIYAFVG